MSKLRTCHICAQVKSITDYSKNQLRKGSKRKCNHCISNRRTTKSQSKSTIDTKSYPRSQFKWNKCADFPINSAQPSQFISKNNQSFFSFTPYPRLINSNPYTNGTEWILFVKKLYLKQLQCHQYNISTNEWIDNGDLQINEWTHTENTSNCYGFNHFLLRDPAENKLYALYFEANKTAEDGTAHFCRYDMTKFDTKRSNEPAITDLHDKFEHTQLRQIHKTVACIDGKYIHIIHNCHHYFDRYDEYDGHPPRSTGNGRIWEINNDKENGLFHLKHQNKLILINGFDTVLFCDLSLDMFDLEWKKSKVRMIGNVMKDYRWLKSSESAINGGKFNVKFEYVLTKNEKFVIIIASFIVEHKDYVYGSQIKNVFYILDIDKLEIVKSDINNPPQNVYYKGIIIDEELDHYNFLLISRFYRNCFDQNENKAILPLDIMELIGNWYRVPQETLHLLGDNKCHYKMNVRNILNSK